LSDIDELSRAIEEWEKIESSYLISGKNFSIIYISRC